jgi:hypothetical protein
MHKQANKQPFETTPPLFKEYLTTNSWIKERRNRSSGVKLEKQKGGGGAKEKLRESLTEKEVSCEKKVTGNRVPQAIRLSSPQDYKIKSPQDYKRTKSTGL